MRPTFQSALLVAGLLLLACGRTQDEANAEFLAEAAAEPGAVQTQTGLIYLERTAGTGARAVSTSNQVDVSYVGRLTNGSVFQEARITIALYEVIPCWTEGIALMKEGGTAKLTCPPELAYGEFGSGPIPENAAISFEVELHDVVGL